MIIYFSGTGNSLSVAKNLAAALDESIMHINTALKLKNLTDKRIGFVYPTYNYDMPRAVQEDIGKLSIGAESYVFGVVTHGGNPGNCLHTLKTLVAQSGSSLSYGAEILMPVSSRIAYGGEATQIEELVEKQKDAVEKCVQDIKQKKCNAEEIKEKRILAMMSKWVGDSSLGKKLLKKNVDPERCAKCGMCAKICPVDNITMTEDGPVFGDKCTDCLACVHWCPQAAIGFRGKNIRKEQQYHHPEVQLKDMVDQKGKD